jgi:hypothetical protein
MSSNNLTLLTLRESIDALLGTSWALQNQARGDKERGGAESVAFRPSETPALRPSEKSSPCPWGY